MGWTLRGYQRECLRAIGEGWKRGVRRQLISLPTGTGKTVIFASFPNYFRMRKRMLVLAHREELLQQARDKMRRANPDLKIEIEQAAQKASSDSDVVIASIPTLGRLNSQRLLNLDPNDFYLIVIDEAHHAAAPTYRRVLEHLGVFDAQSRKLLAGFTATPKRSDGQGLDEVFQEIVFSRNLPEMVEQGYLAPLAGRRIETDVDLSQVKKRLGDFVVRQLALAVNIEERNALVIDVYREHLEGRPTLCFCVDVTHAEELARAFQQEGIPAEAVIGRHDRRTRSRTLESFRKGEIDVLTNCMVLSEGFDEPSISGIILARPTRSALLYTQMIGRGTRPYPAKKQTIVVDIVDVTKDHGLVTLPSLFALDSRFDMEGSTIAEIEQALEWVDANRPWVRVDLALSLSDLRQRCKTIDLKGLETPPEVRGLSSNAWTKVGRAKYRLGIGKGETLSIQTNLLGQWECSLRQPGHRRISSIVDPATSLDKAVQSADEFLEANRSDRRPLIARTKAWRRYPASPRQLELLKSQGFSAPKGITKGQASHLLDILFSR